MKHSITVERLFEEFVEQIDNEVNVVATQVPYTSQQIVSISFTMMKNSGIYYDVVKKWRRKDTADKSGKLPRRFSQEISERY